MQEDIGLRYPESVERLYIDFDSFFASVEQQLRPELRGRPVGVLPLDSPYTSIIAASYEAKKLGIKTGTPVQEARLMCPGIALPIARHDEYVRQHLKIVDVVKRHLPVIKVWSIDEVECELIGRERTSCLDIARAIRQDLANTIGPFIVPSIGIASNQFLAKVAAEMEKPAGLVVLHPADLPGRLFDLELRDLPGIAGNMQRRLSAANITSVEAFWNMAPKQARAIWRSIEGERLWAQLHGFSVTKAETVRRMFGHGRVLGADWRTHEKALICARLLTVKAARRMRKEGYAASLFHLSFSTTDGQHWSADKHLASTIDDHSFLHALSELFRQGTSATQKCSILKISVFLHGLTERDKRMDDLLETNESRLKRSKWESLTDTMDSLNSRYKSCVLSVGIRQEPPGGYAGAKIAFGRIPDLEDF